MKLFAPDGKPSGGFTPPKVPTSNITPMKAVTPPKEVLERNFEMDPSLLNSDSTRATGTEGKDVSKTELKIDSTPGNTNIKAPIQTKEEVEKVEETTPKPNDIKSILTPPGGKKEEKIKQIVPPSKEKITRDYSGLDNDTIAHFKQMSDGAYKWARAKLNEIKKLKELEGATFLQHPDAYTLSPDFKENQTQIQLASQESNLWQQALLSCRAAKPFKIPVGYNQDGSFKMSEDIQPTDAAELNLQRAMLECDNAQRQLTGKLDNLKQGFSQRAQNDNQMIQAEMQKRFAWVADPSLLDYTIEIGGIGPKKLSEIKEDVKSLFPPYYRNMAPTEVCANLMVALRIQSAQLEAALANQKVAETKHDELKRAEPNSIIKPAEPGGEAINGVRSFSLEGLPS